MKITLQLILLSLITFNTYSQVKVQYTISIPEPSSHQYSVEGKFISISSDTLVLKLPNWMPGYYQLMDYAKGIQQFNVKDNKGNSLKFIHPSENTWIIPNTKRSSVFVSYNVLTNRQFVANSYVDSSRAYIIPGNSFFYPINNLQQPVQVTVKKTDQWKDIATGLDPVKGSSNAFMAKDFDILYDSPILIGNLEELESFRVQGISHRFIGYKPGNFDKVKFMSDLKKIVETASSLIGDIPYDHYTFIAIGPGRGGIEHLNNTTISFDGNSLSDPSAYNRMMNFIAHEYFHHYNVKRIRPLELGPFDYDKGNRTNLLWVSEGLSVYYKYLVVKRAGLMSEDDLLKVLSANITSLENNPGKNFQSLQQASYNTWSDGPFGTQGRNPKKAISYYDKGPVVGLLLDLEIRHATKNKHSLDDVMRLLYWRFYKEKQRGFTEAEFQQACEEVAQKPLMDFFEYIYTTKDLDYNTNLDYAGLELINQQQNDKKVFALRRKDQLTDEQQQIYRSWLMK